MKTSRLYQFVSLARKLGHDFRAADNTTVQAMRQAISQLEHGTIQFSIRTKPDGTWLAQSSNVDGIITGGTNQTDQDAMIKDAIFTYYGIAL